MSLEYDHNFDTIEELKAKDSFFTLDEEIRECQEEPENDCNSRKYMDNLKDKCQCLTWELKSHFDKVQNNHLTIRCQKTNNT